MAKIESIQPDVLSFLDEYAMGYDLAVELGAGRFEKLEHTDAPNKIGVEICEGYIKSYDPEGRGMTAVCMDMREFGIDPTDKSVLMMIDSLEHIPRGDGMELLDYCKGVFCRLLVVTPYRWSPQVSDVWGFDNKYQRHLSFWTENDLGAQGFDVVKQVVDLSFGVWNS